MSDADPQDALTLLAGAMLLTVGATDLHLRYVKEQMQPLLLVSGAVLLVLGLRGIVRALRDVRSSPAEAPVTGLHEDPLAHGHGVAPSSWLIALPLVVLALVAPPSLGSYAAARTDTRIAEPVVDLPPLPAPRDGAVDLTVSAYFTRVLYDTESLEGARVRLTGFVTPVDGRWFVTRMALSCCAADGRPVKVLTTGEAAATAPAADSWVEVVGRYTTPETPPGDEIPTATIAVERVTPIQAPRDPYE